MTSQKPTFLCSFISVIALLSLLLAACGSSGSTGSSSSSSSSSGTTPAATASAPTPTPTTSSEGVVIKTATATVKGQSVTILTNDKGMTLYYFTPDTATTSACTGGCASTWPALLYSGSGSPASATSLSGTLKAQQDANGLQVEYNGHLLYTFAGDSKPGQTNGEGILGKWFVATTTLAAAGSAPQPATPTTSSGY
jgi:predicted lipoprotein with Yx(FWY)xxD motif